MKIRSGFVSNSSSSSFVMLGFRSKDEEIKVPKGYGQIWVDGEYFYGLVLTDGEWMDFVEVIDIPDKIKKISEDFGRDISEIKLYAGTREC
jgi:hypothetical protein